MEDEEFIDMLYQLWTKTTGAKDAYWMTEPGEETDQAHMSWVTNSGKHYLGGPLHEADADWITAIHGCFPDLVRRMHEALDEAERLDLVADTLHERIADLEMEIWEKDRFDGKE